MVDAAPFAALRYDPDVAGDPATTSAPAYDLIEPFSYARHRAASPYTVLELLAPDGAYTRSGQLLAQWRRGGVLVADGPALFRYDERESRPGGTQRGLLAAVRIEELDGGAILAHEEVDEGRVAARLRQLQAVPAELDPVYMLLEDPPAELTGLLSEPPAAPPLLEARDESGTEHRLWALHDADLHARLARLLAGTRALILDGHHRYARSLAYRAQRRRAGVAGREQPWERVLAYLVDPRAGGPRAEALHRLLSPVRAEQWALLADDFVFEDAPSAPEALLSKLADTPGHAFGLVEPSGAASVLRARDDDALEARLPRERSPTWRRLDAAILAHAVLPRLGLAAEAVRYRADVATAFDEVARSYDSALLLQRPVTVETVHALASAGERLPYKSTRFLPKPRTGLLLRPLED